MFKVLIVSNESYVNYLDKKFIDSNFEQVDSLELDSINLISENFIGYNAVIFQLCYPLFPKHLQVLKTLRNVFQGVLIVVDQYDFYKNRYFCDANQIDLYYPLISGVEGLIGKCRNLILEKFLFAKGTVIYKDIILDLANRSCIRADKKIELRHREFELLRFLLENPGRIFSANQLLEVVWDMNSDLKTNTVQSHISFLRKKIDVGFQEKVLHTVSCVGYKIE